MKQVVTITEVEGEGLESLLNETVTLFCLNYIYTGKLVSVNDKFVKLQNPKIVYETGQFNSSEWKDAQQLPKEFWYVQTSAIESFGVLI